MVLVINSSATEVDTVTSSLGETFQPFLRHMQIGRVFESFLSED